MEPALENAKLFKEYFNAAKKTQGNDQWRLSAYKAKDYLGMDTFIAEDGSFGFALKEGDIVSVFADARKAKGAAYSIIPAAIDNGGTLLDCFDGDLP